MPRGIFPRKIRPVIIPIGPSIAYAQLTQGQFACIESRDAERVGQHNWFARYDPSVRGYYASSHGPSPNKKLHVGLQEFILGKREGYTVDHKEPGNGLDCRRANLRHANQAQQTCNQRLRSDNASGFKGVSWYPPLQKWRARIRINKVLKHLGYFDLIEDAVAAYTAAALLHHGEYRRAA